MSEQRLPSRGDGTVRAGRDVCRTPPYGPARVPAAVYTSEERFEAERERLFRRSWYVVDRSSAVPNEGDYVLWEEFGESVVICRHSDGDLYAFHNVCQHRGARIVTKESGFCPQLFTCAWHGFRYDRTGLVRGVPDRANFDPAELDALRAPAVAVAEWGGWIWINLAGEHAPPLEDWLGPEIIEELGHYRMEDMVLHAERTWPMPVNWKVVVEGFIETYHVSTLHAKSVGSFYALDDTCQWLFDRHSMYVVPFRDRLAELFETEDHIRTATCHYLVFPNSIFNCNPTHIQFFMPVPIDAHTSKYRAWNLILPGGDDEYRREMDDLWAGFQTVAEEDLFAATQVGLTRRSMGYTRNILTARECRIPHFLDAVEKMLTAEH